MLSYPTDLSAQELLIAEARLRELAEKFTADQTLRSPQWREVFTRTWRHPYVPSFYPKLDAPCLLSIDPQRRREWLDAVYSDQTLITKVVQVPLSPALGPGTYPVYASSSTLPSLMLTMLEALDVHDGQRVLEVGTGTGYNTALLCARLGSEHVTSVDIDPELIGLATERLAANGHTPTLAARDGADGYPPGAPYERIIATCGVRAIPPAWLAQSAPDGVILADVHGPLGGTLARLTVHPDGTATGRFLPQWAGFMWLRHTIDIPPPAPPPWLDDEPVVSVSQLDPALIQSDGLVGFVAQWHLPDVTWGPVAENGVASIHLWAPDGSRASVRCVPTTDGYPVSQAGPQRLWNRMEEAHRFWQRAGRPSYDQFGITATPTDQYVWYEHPDSKHRWPLPTPTVLPAIPAR